MQQVKDNYLRIKISGLAATHYRISHSDINSTAWKVLNEDYIIEYLLPFVEGTYDVSIQLKNKTSESSVFTKQILYQVADPLYSEIPTDLILGSLTYNSFDLTWKAPTDPSLVIDSYKVYINNEFKCEVSGLSASLSDLISSTLYSVYVKGVKLDNSLTDPSTVLEVTTPSAPVEVIPAKGNILIAQVFSPSSTIVNTQDSVTVDSCFITLFNKAGADINLNKCKLFWRYDAYPSWHQVNLSGTIKAGKHFLIRGSMLTGTVPETTILSDWSIAVPDLDKSVAWTNFIDPNPEDAINLSDRMVQWAISQGLFYLASKTGVVLLVEGDITSEDLPYNPFLEKESIPQYVDMVGVLGKDGLNDIAETTPINGMKKSLIFNRKQENNVYQDTDDNSVDFVSVSTLLTTSAEVSALILSSRT